MRSWDANMRSVDATNVPRYPTLEALGTFLSELGHMSPEYYDKMMHPVPSLPSVDRERWLLERLTGQTVLHVGCVGHFHAQLLKVCRKVYGVDRVALPGVPDTVVVDIDREPLPVWEGVQMIVLGEVLEHLLGPGLFLERLRASYPATMIIATVPNAFTDAGRRWMMQGYEMVNAEHVCYYSYTTLRALFERTGYAVQQAYWYHGDPRFAEGLIMVARAET